MKFFSISLLCIALGATHAFQVRGPIAKTTRQSEVGRLFSTLDGTNAESLDKSAITAVPKDRLLDVAYGLKDKFGVFVIDKNGQDELRRAVDDLEAVSERPSFDDDTKKQMLGHWTLVCTTTSNSRLPSPIGSGIDTSKLPFFNQGPLKEIRDSLNKCLMVQQAIFTKESDQIDRVEHIIEYRPPKTLQAILNTLPSLNINPLDITRGKVVLVHEADVSNMGPGFSIRLKLDSVVVNVAGTSQYLETDGQDVLGINSPVKEFQAGTFETTYLDDNFRISRTTMESVDQLRVYVRSEEQEPSEENLDAEYFDEFDKFGSEEDDFDGEN